MKESALARRQGASSAVSAAGRVLKRGPDPARVLRVLDEPLKIVTN